MEEAAPQPENPQQRKFVLWPLFFCVMPVLIAFGLFWLINRPKANEAAENKTSSAADLGPRGAPLAPKANGEPHDPKNENTPPANTGETKPQSDKPEDVPVSNREIEIHIKNLKFAVQHNNGKGRELESEWLKAAKPRELVRACLFNARDLETDPLVRLAWFQCLAEAESELQWARWAQGKWAGRFLGTDMQLDPGNIEEFSAYACALFEPAPLEGDALALARNALANAQPPWLLEVLARVLARVNPMQKRVKPVWPELAHLLESGTLRPGPVRNDLFVAWSHYFDSIEALIDATRDMRMQSCLAALLAAGVLSSDELQRIVARVGEILSSEQTADMKREFILALFAILPAHAADVRPLIEAGILRRDSNLPDFLAAMGKLAANAQELKRLAEFANESNADVARGAINGLRQSPLKSADDELRTILSVGQNSGVKGDALAALLERNPQTRDSLVDEYLLEDKPVVLRVIAVSYLSDRKLEKLKELGENDPEMRVREAAINKLGSLKDKALKTWFTRVSRSDPVPVLRQLAKKYAAELGDQNKSPERSDR